MRLTLLLPLLVAFADAQRGYNSYDEMAQAQMMYRQQEQAAKAAQAQRQRELQAQQQAALLQQARQQALYEQHLRADAAKAAGRSRGGERGLLGRVFSLKGLVLLGGVGYLYVAQRQLLAALVLKPVALLVKAVWAVAIKPILRKFISRPGGAYGGGGGELPGGY